MKRIIVSAGAIAMSLAIAAPAFAAVTHSQLADRLGSNTLLKSTKSTTTVATSQNATVNNSVTTDCNSGDNTVSSVLGDVKGATITTGNSECGSMVNNDVNSANVNVNAKTTIGGEATTPTTEQGADRLGNNTIVDDQQDDAVVVNASDSNVANTQASSSKTGGNTSSSVLGDNVGSTVTTGTTSGVNSLTQKLNSLMLTVMR